MSDNLIDWQRDIWDTMSLNYASEVEPRFAPITEECIRLLNLHPGDRVVDLGCGTGAIALAAAEPIGLSGHVTAVDISPRMLAIVRQRALDRALTNVTDVEGRAESIPLPDASHDALCASLSLMVAIDKEAAVREICRVLAPGGRVVIAVWAGPERNDLVRFQRIAGSFAPEPPAKGVGPGSMAKPAAFLQSLAACGVNAHVEERECTWSHPSLNHAWETFSAVTAQRMSSEQVTAAKAAIAADMWPDPGSPREFRNTVLYLVGGKH